VIQVYWPRKRNENQKKGGANEGRNKEGQTHNLVATGKTDAVKVGQDLARGKHAWRQTVQRKNAW